MGLAAYIVFIGLIFLTLFKDRRFGIFYFLPFLPFIFLFEKIHEYPIGKDIVDIMLIVITIGWFLQNREFTKTDINRPLYFFTIFTFFELLNGYIFLGNGLNLGDMRLQEWKNYILMPVIFFIVVNNIKNLKEIKKLIFLLSIIYLIIGLKYLLT